MLARNTGKPLTGEYTYPFEHKLKHIHPRILRLLWYIVIKTVHKWLNDKSPHMGAALAFYSVLSLGPLLLIVIAIAGLAFGQEAASGHVITQIRGLVGNEGAEAIQTVLANSSNTTSGFWATLIGLVTLFIAATGVFGQLQAALNHIWRVKPLPAGKFFRILRKRFLSFAMISGIGFLLLVSLVVSAGLSALGAHFNGVFPELIMQGINLVVSFGVITILFAMMFKILPDTSIDWGDVWIGAAITALLFSVGKLLIGLYLGHSALSSTYGAAGSLIVLLIWIYYSAQIFLLGAEFTHVYARYIGSYHHR